MINLVLKNRLHAVLILAVSFLFMSCGNEVLVDNSEVFEEGYWEVKNTFATQFEVNDTVNNYNFFVTLRNTNDYPYQNLYVFLKTEFPNGKQKIDTINCPLASAQGNWLGKGFAGVYDNRVLYMARKRFPLTGPYKISIAHGMRENDLPGILDVGVRIEKAP